jgi:hypothetical protein
MRQKDIPFLTKLDGQLRHFSSTGHELIGLAEDNARDAFAQQIVESIRRVGFTDVIQQRALAPERADPSSDLFDPFRAAVVAKNEGNFEEACWLVFLGTQFGKHGKQKWSTTAQVYGALGGPNWTFERVSLDSHAFSLWLERHQNDIKRCVGNHRKYISLSGLKLHCTGVTVETYVAWVLENGGHQALFDDAIADAKGDARAAFAKLFNSMDAVDGFGRTAKFDYLGMIGKLGLADLRPDSVHLSGATGPLTGSKLLFAGYKKAKLPKPKLEAMLLELGDALELDMGVIEDAICNWQKNPNNFVPYRG